MNSNTFLYLIKKKNNQDFIISNQICYFYCSNLKQIGFIYDEKYYNINMAEFDDKETDKDKENGILSFDSTVQDKDCFNSIFKYKSNSTTSQTSQTKSKSNESNKSNKSNKSNESNESNKLQL